MGIRRRLFQYLTIAVRPLQIDVLAERPVAFVGFNDDRPPQCCVDWPLEDGRGMVLSACSSLIAVVSVDGSPVAQLLICSLIPLSCQVRNLVYPPPEHYGECLFDLDKPRFQYERSDWDHTFYYCPFQESWRKHK